MAAKVAISFLQYPGGWRNSFRFLIVINAISLISWYIFYREWLHLVVHQRLHSHG